MSQKKKKNWKAIAEFHVSLISPQLLKIGA